MGWLFFEVYLYKLVIFCFYVYMYINKRNVYYESFLGLEDIGFEWCLNWFVFYWFFLLLVCVLSCLNFEFFVGWY